LTVTDSAGAQSRQSTTITVNAASQQGTSSGGGGGGGAMNAGALWALLALCLSMLVLKPRRPD
jgi:hypothetical protein